MSSCSDAAGSADPAPPAYSVLSPATPLVERSRSLTLDPEQKRKWSEGRAQIREQRRDGTE